MSVGRNVVEPTAPSTVPPTSRQSPISGEWDIVYCEARQTGDGSVGVGVWWGDNDRRSGWIQCRNKHHADTQLTHKEM